MEKICLYVEVPVASFRVSQAREYWETYPVPPPATVYGMLLSAVGEEDRFVHRGTEIAVTLLSRPERSVVFRALWRVKTDAGPGLGSNRRPDFQELLTDVRLIVMVRGGDETSSGSTLAQRIKTAFAAPDKVKRYGGLSLGESTHMVNVIEVVDEKKLECYMSSAEGILINDEEGDLSLPVWVDHVGSKGTLWNQFSIRKNDGDSKIPENAWTKIRSV